MPSVYPIIKISETEANALKRDVDDQMTQSPDSKFKTFSRNICNF